MGPNPNPNPNPNSAPQLCTPTLSLTPTVTHYKGGAFFPTGGSSSIAKVRVGVRARARARARARVRLAHPNPNPNPLLTLTKTLVATVTRRGGSCFVRSPVSEILIEGGRAVGVVARGVTMRARVAVISDAGFRNTFGCADAERAELTGAPRAATMVPRAALVPIEVGAKQRTMLQAAAGGSAGAPPQSATAGAAATGAATGAAEAGAPPARDAVEGSVAMVYLFVGLDASDAALGIRAQNTWVLRDYDADAAFDHFEVRRERASRLEGMAHATRHAPRTHPRTHARHAHHRTPSRRSSWTPHPH